MTPLLRDMALALLIIMAAWLLSWLARILLRQMIKLIGRTRTQLDDVLVEAAQFPLQAVVLIVGIQVAIDRIERIPVAWDDDIERVFFVLYAILLYIFLYRLLGGLIYWYGREMAHRTETDLDNEFLDLFRHAALVVLSITVVIIVLGRFGIEVSALVTTLGIGSLAFALAAQETLGNMIVGFTLLVDQPFKVGDRVEILDIDTWGDVTEIGLRSTRILTRDNRLVSVPNAVIGKGLVVNHSVPDTKYRVETHVGVAYGTELERARRVMIEAIRVQDWVMKNQRIEALFLEFGDSGLIFRVRCWIEHYVETRRIIDKMNTALYGALNEAGISIPFPQRDLHLVSSVTPEVNVKMDGRSQPRPEAPQAWSSAENE
jgi:small-conductance mechanosensitive channel